MNIILLILAELREIKDSFGSLRIHRTLIWSKLLITRFTPGDWVKLHSLHRYLFFNSLKILNDTAYMGQAVRCRTEVNSLFTQGRIVSRAFDYGILFVKNLTNGRISFFFYRLSKFITVCYMNMLAVYWLGLLLER